MLRFHRMTNRTAGRWLLLIHQIPPEPAYVRVKTGRRLARLGAVPLKNSVYVLPRSDATVEDFQWIRRELVERGGEATVVDATLVDGHSDAEVEALFREARGADYREVVKQLKALAKAWPKKLSDAKRAQLTGDLMRCERRMEEIASIDFFGASEREAAAGLLSDLHHRLAGTTEPGTRLSALPAGELRGRVWVTRAGVHVDRIGSAWLVRRFVDPEAAFKFVAPSGYEPASGELRFDMAKAEFTHEGDACTFEVLCERLRLRAPGLQAVAEVVHDIDLKDGKFARPETPGFAALIAGLALQQRDDVARLEHGGKLFDMLLAYFARKRA